MTAKCGDCHVEPGQPHDHGCDVARCQQTGIQQLSCDRGHRCGEDGTDAAWCAESECEPVHDCGSDVWTGEWPGKAECREFGWYAVPRESGVGWRRCAAGTPGAVEDLNRLRMGEANWDRATKRWVLR